MPRRVNSSFDKYNKRNTPLAVKPSHVAFAVMAALFLVSGVLKRNVHDTMSQRDLSSAPSLLDQIVQESLSQPVAEEEEPKVVEPTEKPKIPQDSTHATVMGMATNYNVGNYERFVGSLRRSGFKGNIILAISPVPKPGVEEYLTSQNVTMKRLNIVECSNDIMGLQGDPNKQLNGHSKEVMTCADPYPDLKVRWGRFALLRVFV